MEQRENITFELLRDPIWDYGTNADSDAPQKIMRATALCSQEQECVTGAKHLQKMHR